MSVQDEIDALEAQQGIVNSVSPSFLAERMQGSLASYRGEQVIFSSIDPQVPTVNQEPLVLLFPIEHPYLPATGLIDIDPLTGVMTTLLWGKLEGHLSININRSGNGQGEEIYVWMEWFWTVADGGNDEWVLFGQPRPLVSRTNEEIPVEVAISILNMVPGRQYRFAIATEDATEGIGAIPVPTPSVNLPPPLTGISPVVPSVEINMVVYDYGQPPAP